MNRAWILMALASVVLAGGAYITASQGEAGGGGSPEGTKARAKLVDANNVQVGTVKLEQEGDVVQLKVSVAGSVSAGFHGFHVHTTAACVAPFTTAGGHYNPGGATHRNHAGDLPVLFIDADGEGTARFATDRFSVGELLEGDGSAFILHANTDNYANIPTDRYDPDPDTATLNTGDAGARIACGIIESK